jgi:hypothetical protein
MRCWTRDLSQAVAVAAIKRQNNESPSSQCACRRHSARLGPARIRRRDYRLERESINVCDHSPNTAAAGRAPTLYEPSNIVADNLRSAACIQIFGRGYLPLP